MVAYVEMPLGNGNKSNCRLRYIAICIGCNLVETNHNKYGENRGLFRKICSSIITKWSCY